MKHLIIAALLCLPLTAPAQDDPSAFGLWTSAEVTKKLSPDLNIGGALEFRTQNALSNVDSWRANINLGYKPLSWLKIGVGYTFLYSYRLQTTDHYGSYSYIDNIDDTVTVLYYDGYNYYHPYWVPRHRVNLDVTGSKDIGRFEISLRERLQLTHRSTKKTHKDRYRYVDADGNKAEDEDDVTDNDFSLKNWNLYDSSIEEGDTVKTFSSYNKVLLRSRLQVKYNIPRCKVDPYASLEFFNNLRNGFAVDKTRLTAGVEWKINKQNNIDIAYRYINTRDDDIDLHVLNVTYKHKF